MRYRLPPGLRSFASLRAGVSVYSGTARGTPNRVSLLYVGNGTNREFVLRQVFDLYRREHSGRNCNIWAAGQAIETYAKDVDFSIVDVPWPYEIRYADEGRILEIPAWIRQARRIDGDWDSIVAGFHRNVRGTQLRKIRQRGLTYRTTSDPAQVDSFYDRFYRPYLAQRFGAAASIAPRAMVRAAARSGTLLQVLREDSIVAAAVLRGRAATLQMSFVGFPTADLRRLEGASAAMYFYTLAFAHENEYRSVDFVGSRPVLSDGVLRTKRGWGAAVYDDWAMETLLLQFNRDNPAVQNFLYTTPLIVRHGDMLVGKVLAPPEELTEEGLRSIQRRFTNPGLDRLVVYATKGFSRPAVAYPEWVPRDVSIVDLRGRRDIVAAYCDDALPQDPVMSGRSIAGMKL